MRRWRPSPIRSTPFTDAAGREQDDAGVAEPARLEPRQLVGQLERRLGRGQHRVDALPRLQVALGERGLGVRGQCIGEGLDVARRHRQPRGDAMAAVALQVLAAGGEAGVQVVGRDAAARALALVPVARRSAPPPGRSARRGARRRCRRRPRASPATRARTPRRFRHSVAAGLELVERRRAGSRPRRSGARGSAPPGGSRAPRARPSSVVRSSSSASPGWHRRPAALMRGASRKPTSDAPIRARSTRAAAMSARRPGRVVRASRRRPARTSPRFSSTSGTTSAIVASATRSRCSSSAAGSRPAWAKSAWASLKTTPVPDSSRERILGRAACTRAGRRAARRRGGGGR